MESFLAIYRLVLRHQINRGRLILFGAVALIAILFGFLLHRDTPNDPEPFINFISEFGFSLAVPILSLVLATAAIGQWLEDETLVYVWLRPVSRFTIAAASMAAALTVTVPLNTAMMMLSTAVGTGFDGSSIVGAGLATVLITIAYTTVFVALGATIKQSLISGFVYVFVWEGIVSRFGNGTARLSIRSYATSILSRYSDVPLDLANRAVWSSYAVPLGLAAAALAVTTWVLQNKDVP